MSAPVSPGGLSEQQRAAILAQLGDAQPATNGLLESFGQSIADRIGHDHASTREDWFCLNLSAYMGEKAAPVLRRLLDAEAEAEALRKRVTELEADQRATNEALDVAVKALVEKNRRYAELEARPLAWAEQLDPKSLDNLLATIEQAAGYEPMSGAIDWIHEVLSEFRAAASARAEAEFAAEAGHGAASGGDE